jgi:hypothetical protein
MMRNIVSVAPPRSSVALNARVATLASKCTRHQYTRNNSKNNNNNQNQQQQADAVNEHSATRQQSLTMLMQKQNLMEVKRNENNKKQMFTSLQGFMKQ